jgi:hypothetical protein
MNNPCTLIKVFHCPIKLFAIPFRTKSIHEGLCDPWIAERDTILSKKSSGMKLGLQSYSEKTSSFCDRLQYSYVVPLMQLQSQLEILYG